MTLPQASASTNRTVYSWFSYVDQDSMLFSARRRTVRSHTAAASVTVDAPETSDFVGVVSAAARVSQLRAGGVRCRPVRAKLHQRARVVAHPGSRPPAATSEQPPASPAPDRAHQERSSA